MRKVLRYIFPIVMIGLLLYLIITGKFTNIIEVIASSNDKFEYTNEFKINRLQSKQADFYYNHLSENQKSIYSAIAKGVNKLDEDIIVSKYNIESVEQVKIDTKEAVDAFLCDHPEVFYMNSQYAISLTQSILGEVLKIQLDYSVTDKNDLENDINKMDLLIETVVTTVQGMSEYEKELFIHDFLAKNIKYYEYDKTKDTIPNICHTSYAGLVNSEAVCDGISKTFQMILDRIGIENYIVTGTIDSTPHAWNLLKIENEWVHVDITSNKYIKDENGKTIEAVHTYFNVSTEFVKKTHTIYKEEILPIATTDELTYYKKNNAYIALTEDFDKKLKEIVKSQGSRQILEIATEYRDKVPDKLIKVLSNINFNNIKSQGNNISMNYYNEQNVYIVPKK